MSHRRARCAPHRKSALFRAGQSLNPYPPRYRAAFAFSSLTYLHVRLPRLRLGYSWAYALHRREGHTGLPRFVEFTDRLRALLYAGWVYRCVGSPSILTNLPNIAILALEPNGRSSSALVTTCKQRFRYLTQYRSFPKHRPCAAHFRCAYQVLETPPLPMTPPWFGNR